MLDDRHGSRNDNRYSSRNLQKKGAVKYWFIFKEQLVVFRKNVRIYPKLVLVPWPILIVIVVCCLVYYAIRFVVLNFG